MATTQIVYARMELKSYSKSFELIDRKYEINERLFEVLSEEFYTEPLTKRLIELHPEIFADYVSYRKNYEPKDVATIQAVGKFEVTDQKVELIDIRFN